MKEYVYGKTAQFALDNSPHRMEDIEGNPITGIVIEYVNQKDKIITLWKDGVRHNANSPAIIDANGELYYYLYDINLGMNLSNEQFKQRLKELVFS